MTATKFGDTREDAKVSESWEWEGVEFPSAETPVDWVAEFNRQFTPDPAKAASEPVQAARMTPAERKSWDSRVKAGTARKEKHGGCWWFFPA